MLIDAIVLIANVSVSSPGQICGAPKVTRWIAGIEK